MVQFTAVIGVNALGVNALGVAAIGQIQVMFL